MEAVKSSSVRIFFFFFNLLNGAGGATREVLPPAGPAAVFCGAEVSVTTLPPPLRPPQPAWDIFSSLDSLAAKVGPFLWSGITAEARRSVNISQGVILGRAAPTQVCLGAESSPEPIGPPELKTQADGGVLAVGERKQTALQLSYRELFPESRSTSVILALG